MINSKDNVMEVIKSESHNKIMLKEMQDMLEFELKKRSFLREAPVRIELSKRYFWEYLKVMNPNFFKEENLYQKDMAYILQGLKEGRVKEFISKGLIRYKFGSRNSKGIRVGLSCFIAGEEVNIMELEEEQIWDLLVINIPPRHGKTYMITMFSSWLLGKDLSERIVIGAYNSDLSTTFSKSVRNTISADIEQEDEFKVNLEYNDIFDDVYIKKGDSAMNDWSIEGAYNSYLATSRGATLTGRGGTFIIVDDMVKSAKDAYNYRELDETYSWFTNTVASRLENGGKQAIVGTRWARDDLSGMVLQNEAKIYNTLHYSQPALQDDGTMLAPEVLNLEDYLKRTANMNEDIVEANYNQNIINVGDKVYNKFHLYDANKIKDFPLEIFSYTDPSDQGADYLAHVVIGLDRFTQKGYLLDVIYTDESSEITEGLVADNLAMFRPIRSIIESNSFGSIYIRNIEDILLNKYKMESPIVPRYQMDNKLSRILTHASYCMNNILLPHNYEEDKEMNAFVRELFNFSRTGTNRHDDVADALTGAAELMISEVGWLSNHAGIPIDALSEVYHSTKYNV